MDAPDWHDITEILTADAEELLIKSETPEDGIVEVMADLLQADGTGLRIKSDTDLELVSCFACLGLAYLARRRQEAKAMAAQPEVRPERTEKDWAELLARNAERERKDIDQRIAALASADGAMKAALFELFEELYEDVGTYLCNYDHLIGHEGEKTESLDAGQQIQDIMVESYTKKTGQAYTPAIVRRVRERRRENPGG